MDRMGSHFADDRSSLFGRLCCFILRSVVSFISLWLHCRQSFPNSRLNL